MLEEMIKLKNFINENFEEIHKSPYSKSFYNKKVGWDFKPEGVLRISNHWNFKSKGRIHCRTHKEVKDNHISVGKFKDTKFDILFSIPFIEYRDLDFSLPFYTLYIDSRKNGLGAYIVKKRNFEIDKNFSDISTLHGYELLYCN